MEIIINSKEINITEGQMRELYKKNLIVCDDMSKQYNEQNPAPNSCVNCEYEMTCGYSHLANLGYRTEFSYGECCLGEKSYNQGTFFKEKKK